MIKPKRFIYKNTKTTVPDKEISQKPVSIIFHESEIDSPVNTSEPTEIELIQTDIINSIEVRKEMTVNLPPEELDKRKKLIAKLIKKTDQNPLFKRLIKVSLSSDDSNQITPYLHENQFLHLTPIELQFLINTPNERFNISLLLDIFEKKVNFFEDIIKGKRTLIIFYINRSKVLGSGGLAEVSACLYAKLPETEEEAETAQLKEGAIKIITRQNINEAIKYSTKNELDTLSEIREAGEYKGLLTPIHIGSKTLFDREGNPSTKKHYFITEIIHPLKNSEKTFLSDKIIATHKAEKIIGFIKEACSGLQKIHEQGRIHWDLKPGNIFVGTSNNPKVPDQGKLGDLSCPKITEDFLRSLIIHYKTFTPEEIAADNLRIKRTLRGPREGLYELTLPFIANPLESTKEDLIQIPVTPSYINRSYPHLKLFQKWALTGNPENIPSEILSIVDMGQMAECLDRVREIYEKQTSLSLFPSQKIQRKTVAELTKLVKRLDNIPDSIQKTVEEINTIHKKLNIPLRLEDQISGDQKQPQKKRLAKTQKKLQGLLTKHLMTAEKLKEEFEKIEIMIKSKQYHFLFKQWK